jgi:hypothetical protein
VRPFLQGLCGGRGIKQFCTVVGRRSMLQRTLARVERLIPRERILVIVSRDHRETVCKFWEKPGLAEAHALLRRGAVWNTFVGVAQAAALWEMTCRLHLISIRILWPFPARWITVAIAPQKGTSLRAVDSRPSCTSESLL